MSDLRFETCTLLAARLGPPSPHPQFGAREANQPRPESLDARIPAADSVNIGYGRRHTCLPYLLQDDYGRQRAPRLFETAVLENEILRATFLPALGGRLWSLWHKPSGRELLHVNPVFQPCNLAIRDAWFSGGVEWNFGWPGHTPFTCDRLFAARARRDDGTPVLRLYEYERVRGMPFQMDCYLPDGSPVLLVRVALRNPDQHTVPAYWWSNIAVPECADGRVLVPAEAVYSFAYGNGRMTLVPHPYCDATDRSRPANLKRSSDSFYIVPETRQPWIAAVGGDGRGLFQASTQLLRGRKLFVWGQSDGGRNWQSFLNTPGHPYIEIQAGLERTQASCHPLPGRETREWVEAYGLLEADPALAHGADWTAAWTHACQRIALLAPQALLEDELERTREMSLRPPLAVEHRGSGWGALERRRRALSSEPPLAGPALPFGDETLEPEQQPWLQLLEEGALSAPDPTAPPPSYMDQEAWRALLERSLASGRSDHWFAWLQLGVMHLAAGRLADARQAWETSLARRANAWAARNLAQLAAREGRVDEADRRFRQARALAPADWRLATEHLQTLAAGGRAADCLAEIDLMSPALRQRGRVRLIEARAAVAAGALERFAAIADQPFEVEDVREGDRSLSEVWFDYQARRLALETGEAVTDALRERVRREFPPPRHLDYRM